jgi:hypothetical protein
VKKRTVSLIAIAAGVLAAIVVIVLFVRGQSYPAADGRRAIPVTDEERGVILTEMRGMLISLKGIVEGLGQKDRKRVIEAARSGGTATVQQAPLMLMAKLPTEFRQLAREMRDGFDSLAMAAESGETAERLLVRLGGCLKNCVACHTAYRLDAGTEPTR